MAALTQETQIKCQKGVYILKMKACATFNVWITPLVQKKPHMIIKNLNKAVLFVYSFFNMN